ATLWGDRLNVSYSKIQKVTQDAIIPIPVATSVFGDVAQIQKNVGEIRNTSTEMTASAAVIQTRAIGWNVGFNLTNTNNLVVKLNNGQLPIVLGSEYVETR